MWNNAISTGSVHPAGLVALFPAGYITLLLVFSAWCDMSYSSLGRQSAVFIPRYTQAAWHMKYDNMEEKMYLWLGFSRW